MTWGPPRPAVSAPQRPPRELGTEVVGRTGPWSREGSRCQVRAEDRGSLGPHTGRSRCSLDIPWAKQPSGTTSQVAPSPTHPPGQLPPEPGTQCLGGCHQIPRVQEEPWNLGLGCSGQPWDGVPEGVGGRCGGGRQGAGGHSGAQHGH